MRTLAGASISDILLMVGHDVKSRLIELKKVHQHSISRDAITFCGFSCMLNNIFWSFILLMLGCQGR